MIFSKNETLNIIIPDEESLGVKRVAKKLADDITSVSGLYPDVVSGSQDIEQGILALTAGTSDTAKEIVKAYPFLEQLHGKRECFAVFHTQQIFGIKDAIVIYGSEKISTIYGLFHISELIGISPMIYFGDAKPRTYNEIQIGSDVISQIIDNKKYICLDTYISKEPSVEYRGFFINDEWPCFGNWTMEHFGGFNALMYDHIFEYLLRMKGNYLWPAMWTSSFMLDGPDMESMQLADDYGIYIGMSHHEPCMRSGEEYSKVRGKDSPYGDDWSYLHNKEGLLRFWKDGLKRSKGHNVLTTIGMRGERDSKMLKEGTSLSKNIEVLKEIIAAQRDLISKFLYDDIDKKRNPLLFAVYKEVEDYFFGDHNTDGLRGFKELDDVILLLCEDNFGNMRALPEESDRNHKGGFGMYYHLDYHGDPISYEWVASTKIIKIWEQMTQAYEYGVNKLWIVNVGDVKFQEFGLNFFMDLAYDIETWGMSAENVAETYTKEWVTKIFSPFVDDETLTHIVKVLKGYHHINSLRKPESLNDTVYHSCHYHETDRMLELATGLESINEHLIQKLQKNEKAYNAYFSMIYFPAAVSINLLKMHLFASKNHLYAKQGKRIANVMGDAMEECIRRDEELARSFKEFLAGKWSGMELASHIGFINWNDEDCRYPVRHLYKPAKRPRLIVSRSDEEIWFSNQYFPRPLVIKDFARSFTGEVKIQIANGGEGSISWYIDFDCPWLQISKTDGETPFQDEVSIILLDKQMEYEKDYLYEFLIRSESESIPVQIYARKADIQNLPNSTFISENGLYVISAHNFAHKRSGTFCGKDADFREISDIDKYGGGMKVFPTTAKFDDKTNAPYLTYPIYVEKDSIFHIELHTSPANPLEYGGKLSFLVETCENEDIIIDMIGKDYKGGEGSCRTWANAVLDQEHIGKGKVALKKGINELKIYARQAGIILERILIYEQESNIKTSYLGAPETTYIGRK